MSTPTFCRMLSHGFKKAREQIGVFRQAIPLESRLGQLAPVEVTILRVELSQAAFVFPGGGADEDAGSS